MHGSPITDRTILVTGGAGFIGSHLVDALVADNEVRVLDDLSTGTRRHVPDDVTFIEGDVCEADTLSRAAEGVDLIYHEAAVVSVTETVDSPRETTETNLCGTLAVLDRARRENARVVLASSAAIYGHPPDVPIAESMPADPASPYGVQKLALDRYATLYEDLYDLPTVVLRYFNAYGPRQQGPYSGVISTFLEQARADEPITVEGDGEQTRDFVHVDDVVQANLLAGTTEHVGEAYNVGTGESTSIRELAETIRTVTDSQSAIVHRDARPGDVRHSEADLTNATQDLDFEPTISLAEGLRSVASRTDETSALERAESPS